MVRERLSNVMFEPRPGGKERALQARRTASAKALGGNLPERQRDLKQARLAEQSEQRRVVGDAVRGGAAEGPAGLWTLPCSQVEIEGMKRGEEIKQDCACQPCC